MCSRVLRRHEKAQNDQDKAALLNSSLDDLLKLSRRIGLWLSNPGQGPITIDGREVLLIQESLCILISEELENRLVARDVAAMSKEAQRQALLNRPLTSSNYVSMTPEEIKDAIR